MTDHLSDEILNSLADGELSGDQLASANQHLGQCASCTSSALHLSLLKTTTKNAGQRYAPPQRLQERLARLASEGNSTPQAAKLRAGARTSSRSIWGSGSLGWAAAALLLVCTVSMMFVQHNAQRAEMASANDAALVTEVFDQHVATLAGNIPLQVVSTDRHTVKPWFQGRIPFSFNLPQGLPSDTTLDGANLTYLRNQPVAQLLYSIGKHRVSVFLWQRGGAPSANRGLIEHSGFHEMEFDAGGLAGIAISDVDPNRLAGLVSAITSAQTVDTQPSR